ncbi:SDR family NAD(P)-dependent oxidoreductase [Parahaliea maris]|uniref:SDR family NAD(P)-dependent oxidoreductase n=1 Tax=Parahaliea maris TaxID=2716870 RepID=A0A5C9A5A4_9GAMM|nr:SDR family NAD(P)-dependent oxidoreductase [Parahaliea maris]TXS96073.1 SDR family NAD(P)-dependent oxidoreductase [Parahaliea maris]
MEFSERYGPLAIVTGASSGIGVGFAEELAARGLDLLLVARRQSRLETLAERLRADHGVAVDVLVADLSLPQAIDNLAQRVAGRNPGLLVSNAGFGLKGAHEANDPVVMAEMVQLNCQAPLQLTHRLIPSLRQRGHGGIVITSSVEGLIGVPYSAAYAASKAFTNSLAEGLWGELSPAGIDVLALCPGSTDTEAHEKQGIDRSTLSGMMHPRDVARDALDHLADGPVRVCGEQNRAMFDGLLALPRREALLAMADNIRKALL